MDNDNTAPKVLVTGGTGFLAGHTLVQLLLKGFPVRTTLRSLDRKGEILGMLQNAGVSDERHLEFVEADLTKDEHWAEAMKGCDYVLHMASPFPSGEPKDENELILPAREGTLRVLQAAQRAGVKRVVMTSSFAAVGYSIDPNGHMFNEGDWTDPNAVNGAYVKSKVLAEKAAWDFVRDTENTLELTVINPVGIFGPVLGKTVPSSIQLVQQLMNGKMAAAPKLHFGMVDVRDVAQIHIKAMDMKAAKGERFILTSGSTSLPEIAQLLREGDGTFSKKVTRKVLPNWVVRLLAYVKPELKPVAAQVGIVKTISNEKAKQYFDWDPIPMEVTLKDTSESLVTFKLV